MAFAGVKSGGIGQDFEDLELEARLSVAIKSVLKVLIAVFTLAKLGQVHPFACLEIYGLADVKFSVGGVQEAVYAYRSHCIA